MSRTRCALRGPGDPACGESAPLRPADPAPSPAARAAAAPRATRRERRPRPPAALTGERRGAGRAVRLRAQGLPERLPRSARGGPRPPSVRVGRGPAVPRGEPRKAVAGFFLPRPWRLDLTLRRLRGKAGQEAIQSESVSRFLLLEPRERPPGAEFPAAGVREQRAGEQKPRGAAGTCSSAADRGAS